MELCDDRVPAWRCALGNHDEGFYILIVDDFVCHFCYIKPGKLWRIHLEACYFDRTEDQNKKSREDGNYIDQVLLMLGSGTYPKPLHPMPLHGIFDVNEA